KKKNNEKEVINLNYVPGKISININDYQKLLSNNISNINLVVSYIKLCGDKTKSFKYEIDNFRLPWLNCGSYFVLYIYNKDSEIYHKIYEPLPGKNFIYEYDWSEGSMHRVRKKVIKKDCN